MLYRLFGFGLGVVLRSENSAVKAGDHVYGTYGGSRVSLAHRVSVDVAADFQQYVIVPELPGRVWRVLENREKIPWSTYVGVAGMPGSYCCQTAYWRGYS